MNACKACGAELPPHTETVEFKSSTGKLQYHTHDMAKWQANLHGKVAPEQIVSWSQSERGSKKGLVFGYTYDTGRVGYEGKGEFCSTLCALKRRLDETPSPIDLSEADTIDGPRLRRIRKKIGLTVAAFAIALGYQGTRESREVIINRLERGKRTITPQVARVALLLERAGK